MSWVSQQRLGQRAGRASLGYGPRGSMAPILPSSSGVTPPRSTYISSNHEWYICVRPRPK